MRALWTSLTGVRCDEGSLVNVVLDVSGLPVEYGRGYYLSIGSVDGQPICRVVQLWIPKETQGQIDFPFCVYKYLLNFFFPPESVHTQISSEHTHTRTLAQSQQPDLHTV